MSHPPAIQFDEPVLLKEAILNSAWLGWRSLFWLAVAGIVAVRWRKAIHGWDAWDHGMALKWLAVVCAVVLTWPSVTYDYNYYFDRWHGVDRMVLAVFCVGIIWRPVFLIPFLLVFFPIAWQFHFPLGGISWAAHSLPYHCLMLFGAFYVVSLCTKIRSAAPVLYLACCLIPIHYWPAGFSKVASGWMLHDQVAYLLPSTYANGWAPFLTPEGVGTVTNLAAAVNPMLKLLTFFAECLCIFILWRRGTAIAVLMIWICFHTGIFLMSGICFWQWVLIEICLLVLLFRSPAFRIDWIFSRGGLLLSLLLILSSERFLKPVRLTWADARATNTYRWYATGESGQRYHLPPRFFAPYDYDFTLSRFSYLSREPAMGITWGAASRPLAEMLHGVTTPDEILEIEDEVKIDLFSHERTETFSDFVRVFVDGINEYPDRKMAFRWARAPRLLWTFGDDTEYAYHEPIHSVEAVQVLSFFDGDSYRVIRERSVFKIDIHP